MSWLPDGFRQRQLWQSVHDSDARGVLRWLKAGADPNQPARLDPSLFQSHLPIQEALVRASRSGWSRGPCLVLRLLLSAGGRPILYEPDGLLSPHGRALLVAGVPAWILARSGSTNITRSLEHLLGIWAAKPSRATAEDLCLLLSARARLGQGCMGGPLLQLLFQRAPEAVLAKCVTLFQPDAPEAVAGLIQGRRPLPLVELFSRIQIQWDRVEGLLGPADRPFLASFRSRHQAAFEREQFESVIPLVSGSHRPRLRL